jgi:hypothetical protein
VGEFEVANGGLGHLNSLPDDHIAEAAGTAVADPACGETKILRGL